jgi:hypothetical protein
VSDRPNTIVDHGDLHIEFRVDGSVQIIRRDAAQILELDARTWTYLMRLAQLHGHVCLPIGQRKGEQG